MNRLANPLAVKQAPDARALNKTTVLKIESEQLSTPPIAQEYFEPGVNTKLTRRSKPKTNYTLPSDMPTYPLGFVPVNQFSGALGEEPAEIRVKESAPADLLEVFARINAEEQAMAAMPKHQVDMGSMIMKEYKNALQSAKDERQREMMMAEGFTADETEKAIETVRMEKAIQTAKEPVQGVSVQTALAEAFAPKVMPEGASEAKIPTMNELRKQYGMKPRGRPSDKELMEKYDVLPEELAEARAMEKRGKERMKALMQEKGM